jgi:hypothetical protein
MAFIAWRVAQNMLKQMRTADFSIEVGPQYFAFTREVLVFLTLVLDRMAFERMDAQGRVAFVSALVRRAAEILEENENTLLGIPPAGAPSHFDTFVDLFNTLTTHYADFGFDDDGPDFGFVRYLGHRVEAHMPEKDRRWVIEQMMIREVPEAVETLKRGMNGVLSTEPRPARSSRTATSGD